jgi:hypothetical protein
VGSEILQEVGFSERTNGDDEFVVFSAEDMMAATESRDPGFNDRLQEARDKAEHFFGSKEFSYVHNGGVTYTGTAAQIIDACPHAQTIAGQGGFEAFAAWVAPHEKQEEDEQEPKAGDEETAHIPTPEVAEKIKTIEDSSPEASNNTVGPTPIVVLTEFSSRSKSVASAKDKGVVAERSEPPVKSTIGGVFLGLPAEQLLVKNDQVEKIASLPREMVDAQALSEDTALERQSRAVADTLSHVLSLYDEEEGLVLLTKDDVTEVTPSQGDGELVEIEVVESDSDTYDLGVLLEQPAYSHFDVLLSTQDDESIKTYEDVYELVQDYQDIPVELVLASLFDVSVERELDIQSFEEDSIITSDLFERAFTRSTFAQAILRLRIELAYAGIDIHTTYEELPTTLREQLVDLLYRLGYDDPLRALKELVERQGIEYILYFISQVSGNAERTSRLQTVTLARKKKHLSTIGYASIPLMMARLVMIQLRSVLMLAR